jgi:putative CocE/NonD family hydrolase
MAQRVATREKRQTQFGTYEAEPPQYEGMTTESLYITMRDGVRIAVDVVLPGDLPAGTRIPALLSQTRYWRAMELRAPFKWFLKPERLVQAEFRDFQPFFVSRGYASVLVDVRGTGASFGTWPHPWSRESVEDAREIVDWIVAQPWSNGKVGGHGISYLGTTAELLAALNHPAVRGVIPMFNHPDAYTDIGAPGGIFNERFIKGWGDGDYELDQNKVPRMFPLLAQLLLKSVKRVDADNDRRQLEEAVRAHRENGHAYRMSRLIDYRDQRHDGEGVSVDDVTVDRFEDEIERSDTVIFGWGSWMDAGTADAVIRRFLTFDGAQRAVIGAWEHGGRFNASPYRPPDAGTAPPLPAQWGEMLRFFDCHLKGEDNGVDSEKALFYYTMGEEKWKRTEVWPPEGTTAQRWYMSERSALSSEEPWAEEGSDSYTVDFEASTGDYNRWWELAVLKDKTIVYDDRAEADKHILTYTSPPLTQDTEIAGYPIVTLYLTSTERDGAFFVYLEDVDESGRVTYVTEGQLRAIHRKVSDDPSPYKLQVPYHSFRQDDAMPLVPGEIAEITFGLQPTSVLIRKGHRIRVGIAGHDKGTFPRIPAEGTPVISLARNSLYASCVDLPVVQRAQ